MQEHGVECEDDQLPLLLRRKAWAWAHEGGREEGKCAECCIYVGYFRPIPDESHAGVYIWDGSKVACIYVSTQLESTFSPFPSPPPPHVPHLKGSCPCFSFLTLYPVPWIDHLNMTALIWAGVGGTETGNDALVDILYGAVNPSTHLLYTMAKSPSGYPAAIVMGTGTQPGATVINYSEGHTIFPSMKCRCFLMYPFLHSQQPFHQLLPL
jgi:hypothetical protein